MHTSHISRRQRSLKVFCAAQFRSVRSLFVMLAVALCMAAGASAQENKQYTQNAPDQSLKSDARVDPSTLGMSVSVPLGGAPGRAGSSLPVSLRYSSKQWRIKHTLSWFTTAGSAKSWTHALFSENATAGWTSSLEPPRIEFTAEQQLFDDFGVAISDDPQAPPANAYYIRRLNVHLPDGSSHELRKDDAPQWLDRTNPVYDYTGMFYAVDGSGARYDATNGVLYLADGSRYIFGARQTITRYSRTVDGRWGTTYIDRNGNTLTYNLSTKTWSDTLGRSYAQPLPDDPTVGLQTYSLPGVGGHTLSYTLHWQNLGDSLRAPEAVRYTSNKRCATPNSYPALSPSLFTGGPLLGAYICGDVFNPVVLAKIVLPNGQFYEFKYNVWGEIEQVNAPGGGYERFRYDKVPTLGEVNRPYDEANRGVVEHWISPSGTGVEETTHRWQYSLTRLTSSGGAVATTTAPEGVTRSERVLYSSGTGDYGFGNPLAGMISEERVYNASNVMLRRTLNGWSVITPAGSTRARDPHLTKSVSLILDTGGNALASTTEMHYDADLNVDWTKKYDYASVASSTAQTGAITSIPNGALVRTDETTYLVNDTAISSTVRQSYRDRNLTGLPSSSRIKNSAGTIVAQSEYKYDEAAYPLLTYGAVTGWTDPATSVRGNATTTRSWLDTASAWVEAHAQYDQTGNARYMWDAKGNLSEVEYSSAYHYAYPTLTRSAIPDATSTRGSNTALVTTSVYDFWTGRVTSTKDANGQVNGLSTTYEYNDALDRLTKVNNPDGGWTTYWYGHNAYGDYTGTRTAINATQNTEGYQFFDGLGRAVRSFQLEGSQWITSDTEYDSMGRVKRVSNPYLTGGSGTPINPSGYWTTTAYDALGRTSTVTKPDNAQVTNAYSGNMVTVTDPAGKARRSVTDALGRLVQVVEAPAGVAYPTNYTYDERGNLRKVNQSGQLRYFMYDSLGRLIRARNPEQSVNSGLALQDSFKAPDDAAPNGQWTLGYAYDNNGNLSAKTDARGVTASYTYDPLNRVLDIGYSDGVTPGVGVVYDKAANGRGRFSWNWAYMGPSAANSHTAIDSYDAMGRVTVQRQHFWVNSDWGQAYTISRSYDLAGHVVSQTYPSGHTVNYSQFDVAGRLKQFTGNLGNGVTRTYATNISYDEASRMREEQFGTTSALYHKLHYNVRGQLYDVRLSTVAWATDEWNWNRGALVNHFSSVNGWAATGTDNNGNVLLAQHWVPNNDQISSYQWMNQYYTYDALNRLASVMEQANGATTTGAQVFIYDAFGNRTVDAAQTWGTNIPEPQYTASTATNRLGVPSGYSGVMSYDAAGNLTYDTHTSSPAPGTR
ncbi:MAG TPA: hypothetical protein VGO96_11620, partial [Pyrinomonadaceae bacterium]|nr:hypothetical protein [Pyrinomonadaceae bacterium]